MTDTLSLPVRGAWIEMSSVGGAITAGAASLPVRGAWIEILKYVIEHKMKFVAPRAGSVD